MFCSASWWSSSAISVVGVLVAL
ncbi:hypothetical protein NC653_031715 [Populus alba x Populus x berolinensis]|uniref:Uncharacterized protein n=1 Tax=Populus alba x Populus x berolinensis TaxID=444605 RepID=A0AAD6LZG6_9ROSI|nr:hypothetical protein NC653_031715 [Populus alba x Populus x berolinensis]